MAMISSIKVPINAAMDRNSIVKKNSVAAVKKNNAAVVKTNSVVVTTDSAVKAMVKNNSAKAAMDLRAMNIHLPMLLARPMMPTTVRMPIGWTISSAEWGPPKRRQGPTRIDWKLCLKVARQLRWTCLWRMILLQAWRN